MAFTVAIKLKHLQLNNAAMLILNFGQLETSDCCLHAVPGCSQE